MFPNVRAVCVNYRLNGIVLSVNAGVGQGFRRRLAQASGLQPVLVGFRFDDEAIVFGTELFNMPGLGAADDELIAVSIDSLTDIAESDVVVSIRALPDQIKPDGDSAPGVDSAERECLDRLLAMLQLIFYDAFLFFH